MKVDFKYLFSEAFFDSVDWITTAWKWFINGAFAFLVYMFTRSWLYFIIDKKEIAVALSLTFTLIYFVTKVDIVYIKEGR